jgi:tetratricopeptide (TPR) repeat protein
MTTLTVLAAVTLATASPARDTVPLYTDLGNYHAAITTSVPLAQQYFDQGLRLTYGFNHAEAIRAYREAARLDPKCAICWWGVAFAYGPNINAPMDSASGVEAYKAAREAKRLAGNASPRERAYIDAIQKRYASVPPANRAKLDSAYATAMGKVADRFPDDQDAQTLHADALMNLSPWYYWNSDGSPRPATPMMLNRLESVIAVNERHPGACHLYIHAVEAVEPEKAVPCAERLASLMPGAGHLVHMPAHIYIRVGRFADAVTANQHAVHTDEMFIEGQRPSGIYPAGYYPHNYHFLAFAAMMSGQSKVALEASKGLSAKVSPEIAKVALFLQAMIPYHQLALVSFGHWDEVLAASMPPADLPVATGLAHYARGVAFAATGRAGEASNELTQVQALAGGQSEGSDPRKILDIAVHVLAGEIALRGGKAADAVTHFEAAKVVEDGILYNEPPFWYYPVRESLGGALLAAGRPADAERAFREDLAKFPGNVWSLYGLLASLRAQGKTVEAEQAQAQLRSAGASADVILTGSRF